MNITQLQYLKTAVQEHSYAAAAKKLYVSSQAISKAINELEREIDVPLFEKFGRGVRPTSFAIDFAAQASNVLNDFHRLTEYAHSYKRHSESCGVVNLAIASAGTRGELISEEDLGKFRISHPEISVSPQHHASEICLSAFQEGLVEAAVILGDYSAPGVSCTKVITFVPYLLVGRNHHLSKMKSISLYSLNGVTLARPMDMRHVYRTLKTKLDLSDSRPIIVNPPLDQASFQEFLNLGGSVLIAKTAPVLSRLNDVAIIPFCKESGLEFTLYCINRNGHGPSAAVATYIQSISKILNTRLS